MGWIGTEFGARWSVAIGGIIVLVTGVAAVIVVSRRGRLTFRQTLRIAFPQRGAAA
jgi:hypothetical protein